VYRLLAKHTSGRKPTFGNPSGVAPYASKSLDSWRLTLIVCGKLGALLGLAMQGPWRMERWGNRALSSRPIRPPPRVLKQDICSRSRSNVIHDNRVLRVPCVFDLLGQPLPIFCVRQGWRGGKTFSFAEDSPDFGAEFVILLGIGFFNDPS